MTSPTEGIHQRLLARRRELLRRYRDELERAEEELAERQAEDAERSAEQWDARVLSSLGDADLRHIVAVLEALARLHRGTYGACTRCEEPIGAARLEALPEAPLCIECAAASEARLARSA